jgi:hypothetical protein
MNETDAIFYGSDGPMPRLGGVRAIDGDSVLVNWVEGPRAGRTEAVNLLPLIDNFKVYEPLRRNDRLFSTVHLIADGNAIAWGNDESIDMAATSIERMAEEAMSAEDFAAFLERNRLTHQGAASALGRSRRQIEYYLSKGVIPRIIALACYGYEARKKQEKKAGRPAKRAGFRHRGKGLRARQRWHDAARLCPPYFPSGAVAFSSHARVASSSRGESSARTFAW